MNHLRVSEQVNRYPYLVLIPIYRAVSNQIRRCALMAGGFIETQFDNKKIRGYPGRVLLHTMSYLEKGVYFYSKFDEGETSSRMYLSGRICGTKTEKLAGLRVAKVQTPSSSGIRHGSNGEDPLAASGSTLWDEKISPEASKARCSNRVRSFLLSLGQPGVRIGSDGFVS